MINIKIENPKNFVGSVSWLKDQIENMNFRFGSRDGVPCVDYAFITKNKETGEKVVGRWKTAVVMGDSPETSLKFYDVCKEYNETYITYTSGNSTHEHGWAMFPYLSPHAQTVCERLIRNLADELVRKVKTDRDDLKITVIVGEK